MFIQDLNEETDQDCSMNEIAALCMDHDRMTRVSGLVHAAGIDLRGARNAEAATKLHKAAQSAADLCDMALARSLGAQIAALLGALPGLKAPDCIALSRAIEAQKARVVEAIGDVPPMRPVAHLQ